MDRIRRLLRENASLVVVIAAVAVARGSFADHYVVPTGSMEPTLLPGDRVFVSKTAYGLRLPYSNVELTGDASPRRGDVVIFDSPENGTRLVKRVVAVAGDRVAVRRGHLLLNDRPLADPARPDLEHFSEDLDVRLSLAHGGGPDLAPTVVPEGHLLMMGDARGNSRDGRFFGFVEEEAVYARALRVFYRKGEGFSWLPL
jgi:signal peptidase I